MGGWAGCTPIHPQEAAGQSGGVARRVGVQRIDSCDHRSGIFLATRIGKRRPDCLSDWKEESLQLREIPALTKY